MIGTLPRGGKRGAVNDTTGRLWAGGLCALLAALQFGCASKPRTVGDAERARDIVASERSALGNPPFYEVFGKRYYVLDSAEGFVERGIASWYGPDFHRQRTSSGEIYDMYAMTAAHKTLPLPTWVEVTNLENGRRVVVKVNDRGPFVGDRIIDLSYAAAQALDMVRAGTARVEVRAIDPPSRTLVASAGGAVQRSAADANEARMRELFIQVGAFSSPDNATRLVERLRAQGFDNVFVVSDERDALHRVRVGPFYDVNDYDRATDGLRRSGVTDPRLVVGP